MSAFFREAIFSPETVIDVSNSSSGTRIYPELSKFKTNNFLVVDLLLLSVRAYSNIWELSQLPLRLFGMTIMHLERNIRPYFIGKVKVYIKISLKIFSIIFLLKIL